MDQAVVVSESILFQTKDYKVVVVNLTGKDIDQFARKLYAVIHKEHGVSGGTTVQFAGAVEAAIAMQEALEQATSMDKRPTKGLGGVLPPPRTQ